jgi:hypothetical protein
MATQQTTAPNETVVDQEPFVSCPQQETAGWCWKYRAEIALRLRIHLAKDACVAKRMLSKQYVSIVYAMVQRFRSDPLRTQSHIVVLPPRVVQTYQTRACIVVDMDGRDVSLTFEFGSFEFGQRLVMHVLTPDGVSMTIAGAMWSSHVGLYRFVRLRDIAHAMQTAGHVATAVGFDYRRVPAYMIALPDPSILHAIVDMNLRREERVDVGVPICIGRVEFHDRVEIHANSMLRVSNWGLAYRRTSRFVPPCAPPDDDGYRVPTADVRTLLLSARTKRGNVNHDGVALAELAGMSSEDQAAYERLVFPPTKKSYVLAAGARARAILLARDTPIAMLLPETVHLIFDHVHHMERRLEWESIMSSM